VSAVDDLGITEGARRVTVVDGPTALTGGFDHLHASEEARGIAEQGIILRVQVGPGVHGTSGRGPS
jgi:uncharacterized protein